MIEPDLGPHWAWLQARGWKVEPSTTLRGTAAAYGPRKTILAKPAALTKPDTRIRQYVFEHEMWHAIEWEVCKLGTAKGDTLNEQLGIDYIAAREVVADSAVYHANPTRTMQFWVRASVAWHSKMGAKYKWAHLMAPATLERIDLLNKAVTNV